MKNEKENKGQEILHFYWVNVERNVLDNTWTVLFDAIMRNETNGDVDYFSDFCTITVTDEELEEQVGDF